jgi:ribosome biogenesis GTPase
MNLNNLGWNENREMEFKEFDETLVPGRVSTEHKNSFTVLTESGEITAKIGLKMYQSAYSRTELPVVGDWVAVKIVENSNENIIMKIFSRESQIARKTKNNFGRNYNKDGGSDLQPISSNIDTIFLVMAMDRDFKQRKIERYLALIWESGSNPVIILNKADKVYNPEYYIEQAEEVALGVPIVAVSAMLNEGIDQLMKYIEFGKTITLIGSSGVGKSSIINRILSEDKMYVNDVRKGDDRGRHTTTHRQLIEIPSGGVLIDNPGIRDLKLAVSHESLDATFSDIEELTRQCRFNNCKHDTEPDCAIKNAIMTGELSEERYENYLKLKRELAHFKKRQFFSEKYKESGKWKHKKSRKQKNKPKHRGDYDI